MRFTDDEVLTDIDAVYHLIEEWILNSGFPLTPASEGQVLGSGGEV